MASQTPAVVMDKYVVQIECSSSAVPIPELSLVTDSLQWHRFFQARLVYMLQQFFCCGEQFQALLAMMPHPLSFQRPSQPKEESEAPAAPDQEDLLLLTSHRT